MSLFYGKYFFDRYQGPFRCISEGDFDRIWDCFPIHPPKGKVLDLACGSGELGTQLQALFSTLSLIGADLSLNLLKWANFPKCQSDALDLPFRDNSFDCIVAGAAFHHFPSIKKVIKECSRCLKPEGIFFAYDPNKFHPQRLIMMTNPLRHIFYRNGDHAISPMHFRKMLIKESFKRINIRYVAFRGKRASLLAGLNYKITSYLSVSRLRPILPLTAPWFIITAIKS